MILSLAGVKSIQLKTTHAIDPAPTTTSVIQCASLMMRGKEKTIMTATATIIASPIATIHRRPRASMRRK